MGATGGLALVIIALIAFVAFQQWLRHHRRIIIHRERLAAIEKGIELPQLEQEVQHRSWDVQRLLLLAGLVWISIGIATTTVLSNILSHSSGPSSTGWNLTEDIPQGLEWIGIAPIGIGISHLIVYFAGRNKGR